MKSPGDDPANYPLDGERHLEPTALFYLHGLRGLHGDLTVRDMTSHARSPIDVSPSLPDTIRVLVENQSRSSPADFSLKSKAWHGRSLTLSNAVGAEVASLSSRIVSLGTCQVSFPRDSTHSGHDITLKPTGIGRSARSFVLESVPHFWDVADGKSATLTKLIGETRVEVGRWLPGGGFHRDGVLVVDSNELDVVVAVATCAAWLHRLDSF